jgi:hypothetical protein
MSEQNQAASAPSGGDDGGAGGPGGSGHGGGGGHGGGAAGGTGSATTGVWSTFVTVVVTVIVTAILTLFGTFVFKGGAIRALGGLAVSQVSKSELYEMGTNCGDTREAAMPNVKESFCFLTDISVRQGNSIAEGDKEGWNICKIEKGKGDKAEQFVLIAEMKGTCPPKPGLPEITCKARCIRF